jgi:hypothetical protein
MAQTAVAGLNMKLVEIAMAYQRSRVLCAAARLGVADALKEGERSVQEIAGSCAADAATLHRRTKRQFAACRNASGTGGRANLSPVVSIRCSCPEPRSH